MLDICYEYGHEIGLMFNARKSMCILCGKRLSNSPRPIMFINGMDVKWNNECTYFGIKLFSDRNFKCCADERIDASSMRL